jgi:serine phosphatase RsbU (regulator of sigma subunit)
VVGASEGPEGDARARVADLRRGGARRQAPAEGGAAGRAARSRWAPFLRAFAGALRDPASYDLRRSVGAWLGLLLALPIPVLAFAADPPLWTLIVASAAPVLWAVILGATVRVAQLRGLETEEVRSHAASAGVAHADERSALHAAARRELMERHRLESLQEVMDIELALAQRVHESLLPRDVATAEVQVVVRQIPCSFVGGDYLHVSFPAPDVLYLCVGDVSGHGVSAALVVSRIHGLVEELVLAQRSPADLLQDLHQGAVRVLGDTPLFLTFAACRLDLVGGRVDYATAGHPPQLLVRPGGAVERLSTAHGLLGTSHSEVLGTLPSESAALRPGDTLVLFTDGLFEVAPRGGGGERLGESKLSEEIRRLAHRGPAEIAEEVLRRVTAFGREGPFEDDVSLVVVRYAGPRTGAGS